MTDKGAPDPARLFVILARKAPVGVIFRRGPSKWVRLIKWDTEHDRFERGQWFHGRIYERRCDLSPDGRLLIYFASKQTGRQALKDDYSYTNTWTAISQPPWLTALALWPKGDCWHGGGLFEFNRTIWLNHHPLQAKPHPNHQPSGLRVHPNEEAHGEDAPVYWRRLERDGWTLRVQGRFVPVASGWRTERQEVWQRPAPGGSLILSMRQLAVDFKAFGGPYVMEYTLREAPEGPEFRIRGATWADWDQRGRLVFTRDGKLFATRVDDPAEIAPQELADFSDEQPKPIEAPAEATRWDW